jgi:hypothetical protein
MLLRFRAERSWTIPAKRSAWPRFRVICAASAAVRRSGTPTSRANRQVKKVTRRKPSTEIARASRTMTLASIAMSSRIPSMESSTSATGVATAMVNSGSFPGRRKTTTASWASKFPAGDSRIRSRCSSSNCPVPSGTPRRFFSSGESALCCRGPDKPLPALAKVARGRQLGRLPAENLGSLPEACRKVFGRLPMYLRYLPKIKNLVFFKVFDFR